jgi:small ligand-binding sensory domain FIST
VALGPGGSRLVVDDELHTSGAVGVLLDRDADVDVVVSQGARPVGEPFVVTQADGRHLLELGGRSAVGRLRELLEALSPEERGSAVRGLQLGLVLDESRATFGRGDFRIRPILGADAATGAVTLGEDVEVGRTVQFQLRDAATADDDLRAALDGRRASGGIVVTSTGRGHGLFGYPDHDADVVSSLLGTRATAGLFAAGEIGPVDGRNLLHGFATAVLLFGPRPA